MWNRISLLVLLILIAVPAAVYADSDQSTRVVDAKQHAYDGSGRYPYRDKSDYVLKELDLKSGDVVVDIGAGDGWWGRQMARSVGAEGVIHASEVEQRKVDDMKEKLADVPQIKPYLSPLDGTALPENSCDLAFLSKTYHHLNEGSHVDYLRHLRKVVKPTGRLCVIEMNSALGSGRGREHAWSPGLLIQQAEEAGWILVRCELMTGTYHFIAIFVQQELFPPQPSRGGRATERN
ncbi:MAG TPA: methyltransferase domain-containing protein [Sedimentisphaerales bacterium]|nr:methyltransferase domain-containing protein [Sedimentisphaerales bacterium]